MGYTCNGLQHIVKRRPFIQSANQMQDAKSVTLVSVYGLSSIRINSYM